MKLLPNSLLIGLLCLAGQPVLANLYYLPEAPGDSLIGESPEETWYATITKQETLLDIARDYNIGQNEILLLNPNVDRWLPGKGTEVRIPVSRILPEAPREGLVLNLSEFRLYYFPPTRNSDGNQRKTVFTHPVSIGRMDWNTPLGTTTVIAKKKDPAWRPPQSIKNEHAADGEILPDVVPAGPDNPLGQYAIRLGIPGYLIHGTNKPYGVGMRVSHGCVRMYPEDIKKLFPKIKIGTKVNIVNQPIKVGWLNNTLYIEVYPELEGEESGYENNLETALNLIQQHNNQHLPVLDGAALRQALEQRNGLPVAIYRKTVNDNGYLGMGMK